MHVLLLYYNAYILSCFSYCCQPNGMFKRVLEFLPMNVLLLYYNAFILSCFSYSITCSFNNDRSGRYKVINKINRLLGNLAKKNSFNFDDFVTHF